VREPERHGRDNDGCAVAEGVAYRGEPEAAVGELLDHGRDRGDDDEVRDERRRATRIPAVGHEALLLAGLEENVEDGADHPDRDERGRDPARGGRPGGGTDEPERRRRDPPRDQKDDREDDRVLDQPADG
jgi:hypothetical protein